MYMLTVSPFEELPTTLIISGWLELSHMVIPS
jgi:hypothetical protein